ncbi:nucleotide exchange factor GrpE [bacterium CG10_46_32]|nr:MAG: nucleotide exchange factor GrpE [bacterium CG10_46_32]PIR55650.1 MAG: nucleotide exchange factor GrpE [Parcubacteria group bacterium CG10_big_fil_rev_8_21_14_0_10_46_32]
MKHDKKTEELQQKADEYLAGWKRSQADYQNLEREHSGQMKKIGDMAVAGFAEKLIPVIDHFELAIKHIPTESKKEEWVQGFYHIKKQFDEMLLVLGISRIKTVGNALDPSEHETVASKESDKKEDEILEEVQAGYRINTTVIRPAKVVVSK